MTAEEDILATLKADIANNRLTLPTLPEVALKIRDVVEDEDATIRDVADVISSDTALSARLIQVSNSPLYRGNNPVDNIQIAITRLGQMVVRNLATSLVMQQMFQATSDVTDKRLRDLWEHNTTVAAISSALSTLYPKIKADIAMLAGLVHDIGALPLLVQAEEIPELLENEELLDKVIEELHTEIGQDILKAWQFPDEIVQVAAKHEDLTRVSPGDGPDYVDIVQVANIQSHMGTSHRLASMDLSGVPSFMKLGLDPEVSVIDLEGVAEEMNEIQQTLCA
ncbi:MAG: HDOD domain-containing protein [Gammaproteobacteria bacterium]|nr:MAG: HDOD domain-containing protein [Gammaproteobacteria bacterium]